MVSIISWAMGTIDTICLKLHWWLIKCFCFYYWWFGGWLEGWIDVWMCGCMDVWVFVWTNGWKTIYVTWWRIVTLNNQQIIFVSCTYQLFPCTYNQLKVKSNWSKAYVYNWKIPNNVLLIPMIVHSLSTGHILQWLDNAAELTPNNSLTYSLIH